MTASQATNPLSTPEPWDLVSAGYAAEAEAVLGPFSERAIAIARAPPDAVVIDVAAGTGILSLRVAREVAEVHAVDFSEAMLAELRRRATELGVSNVQSRVADGQELPYPADTFHAAFSMFGLMFFPDRARGFAELRRVLRPAGIAVVSSWAPPAESSLMLLLFGALREIDPTWKAPERNLLSLENEERFAAEMRGAGFAGVTVLPHVHTLEVKSAQALWSSIERSNAPIALTRRRLGEAVWQERSPFAVAYLESELSRGRLRLSTKAFLGCGIKR